MPAFLQVYSLPCNLNIIYFMVSRWSIFCLDSLFSPVILLGTPHSPISLCIVRKTD